VGPGAVGLVFAAAADVCIGSASIATSLPEAVADGPRPCVFGNDWGVLLPPDTEAEVGASATEGALFEAPFEAPAPERDGGFSERSEPVPSPGGGSGHP